MILKSRKKKCSGTKKGKAIFNNNKKINVRIYFPIIQLLYIYININIIKNVHFWIESSLLLYASFESLGSDTDFPLFLSASGSKISEDCGISG